MPIDFVKNSCLSFERCLKAVIEAGGCHVEDKRLDLSLKLLQLLLTVVTI